MRIATEDAEFPEYSLLQNPFRTVRDLYVYTGGLLGGITGRPDTSNLPATQDVVEIIGGLEVRIAEVTEFAPGGEAVSPEVKKALEAVSGSVQPLNEVRLNNRPVKPHMLPYILMRVRGQIPPEDSKAMAGAIPESMKHIVYANWEEGKPRNQQPEILIFNRVNNIVKEWLTLEKLYWDDQESRGIKVYGDDPRRPEYLSSSQPFAPTKDRVVLEENLPEEKEVSPEVKGGLQELNIVPRTSGYRKK